MTIQFSMGGSSKTLKMAKVSTNGRTGHFIMVTLRTMFSTDKENIGLQTLKKHTMANSTREKCKAMVLKSGKLATKNTADFSRLDLKMAKVSFRSQIKRKYMPVNFCKTPTTVLV
jgi:hypothetical protein